jgi:hypothetical protein
LKKARYQLKIHVLAIKHIKKFDTLLRTSNANFSQLNQLLNDPKLIFLLRFIKDPPTEISQIKLVWLLIFLDYLKAFNQIAILYFKLSQS